MSFFRSCEHAICVCVAPLVSQPEASPCEDDVSAVCGDDRWLLRWQAHLRRHRTDQEGDTAEALNMQRSPFLPLPSFLLQSQQRDRRGRRAVWPASLLSHPYSTARQQYLHAVCTLRAGENSSERASTLRAFGAGLLAQKNSQTSQIISTCPAVDSRALGQRAGSCTLESAASLSKWKEVE